MVNNSEHDDDKSTLSNPRYTRAKHVNWKAAVDFENHCISANATYAIEILDKNCNSIHLDTRGLTIFTVDINDEPVKDWILDEEIKGKLHLGQRLAIPLKELDSEKGSLKLEIAYKTSSDPEKCSAAQWLTPAQTSGKKYPYLFTQCQSIHARSLIPCYDCPAVKMTYNAEMTVPKWATAIMSALSTKVDAKGVISVGAGEASTDTYTFSFEQPVPIPAYLLALAVGDLASKDLSPRCRIWCEPCTLKAAADEFYQTELFLKTAEDITSMPYAWNRYDLLVLPGSFPYGGMENPCLTFVTPTLLAGDGSLVCVVAHEIAHSWTGNLVTNKTWGHFWLNEGWTTWLQRRIMNKIENVPHNMDLDAIGGAQFLEQDIEILDKSMTSLYLKLGDGDPDESYSRVPYEKGFHLLYALERMVGEETFLELVAGYLKKFAYGTVTTEEFREFCIGFWKDTNPGAYTKVKEFSWEEWMYGTGMPPLPVFDKSLAEEAESLAAAWMDFDSNTDKTEVTAPDVDINGWTSAQKVCFLNSLLLVDKNGKPKKLNISTLHLMQIKYSFQRSKNAEILFRFCMLAVQAADKEIYPVVVRFITSQGRMKYIRPLYRALFASAAGREIGVETFLKNKDFYHPIASKMIAYDMIGVKNSEGIVGKMKSALTRNCIRSTPVTIGVAAAVVLGALTLLRYKK
jgi:leukotriene-A4 hydrolase